MSTVTSQPGALRGAAQDLVDGTKAWESWLTLAWYDILLRYRRSMIGPLWITVSMGVMLMGIGPLYSMIFGVPVRRFFPYVTLGIIFWQFISTSLIDGCSCISSGGRYLKQSPFPLSEFVWRVVAKHVIQLAHHAVLFVPVAIWFGVPVGVETLAFVPGFLILVGTLHAGCTACGILCARYRDVNQVVISVLQLAMFLTPVFWYPEGDAAGSRLVTWNPCVALLDVVRLPLLGQAVPPGSWAMACGTFAALFALATLLVARCRQRVVYWI